MIHHGMVIPIMGENSSDERTNMNKNKGKKNDEAEISNGYNKHLVRYELHA